MADKNLQTSETDAVLRDEPLKDRADGDTLEDCGGIKPLPLVDEA